ncbi:hypothetical protein AL064_01120 [Pseudomonas syringae pv. syringae]|nr:hypothetical protein AL064_01120 [Pseudomonas syringae pv. syringae]
MMQGVISMDIARTGLKHLVGCISPIFHAEHDFGIESLYEALHRRQPWRLQAFHMALRLRLLPDMGIRCGGPVEMVPKALLDNLDDLRRNALADLAPEKRIP